VEGKGSREGGREGGMEGGMEGGGVRRNHPSSSSRAWMRAFLMKVMTQGGREGGREREGGADVPASDLPSGARHGLCLLRPTLR